MIGQAASVYKNPVDIATEQYGENHPVTRSLLVGTGASGGFIVPPDYRAEIIELLRPVAVVRGAGPRVIPMPRGTMTIPGQASAATATYGSEVAQIATSQQTLNKIVLSYKKLTAMVPVSNDMMRYSDPAVDAFVRDDLVKVMALREDSAFMFGDGTADTPFGWLTFANDYVSDNGGTIGTFSTAAASTFAVNGTDPANSTGGNFITANETVTVDTVADELGGAINRLDSANVGSIRRVWFMSPRTKNYLVNARNSLSLYIWRDEMMDGTLLGYPFKVSNQIGNNYQSSAHTDCSFIFLVEMPESILADSMQLELAVSRDASYVDSAGATISTFQNDQTLIRAIAEHDFSVRHRASVAVIQRVRYAPAVA
jgi:HK97 family phage major capsid protein